MEMATVVPEFVSISQQAGATCDEMLAVHAITRILFLQAAALAKTPVPLNMAGRKGATATTMFSHTAPWSGKSIKEEALITQCQRRCGAGGGRFTSDAATGIVE